MQHTAAVYPLINLLRLNRIVTTCRRCGKILYRTRFDAQYVADLTLACDRERMDIYPRHGGWHLRNRDKLERRKIGYRFAAALHIVIDRLGDKP